MQKGGTVMLVLSLLASLIPTIITTMMLYVAQLGWPSIYTTGELNYTTVLIISYFFSFVNFWVRHIYTNGIGPLPKTSKIMSYVISGLIGLLMLLTCDTIIKNIVIEPRAMVLLSVLYGYTSINRFRTYTRKTDVQKGEEQILPFFPTKHIWECEMVANKRLIKFSTYGFRVFFAVLYISIKSTESAIISLSFPKVLLISFLATFITDILDIIAMFIIVKLSQKEIAEG